MSSKSKSSIFGVELQQGNQTTEPKAKRKTSAAEKLKGALKPVFEQLEARWMLSAGQLDDTFGVGGKLTTHFSVSAGVGHGVALNADHQIIAVGEATDSSGHNLFGLVRYNADGSLDTTFGAGVPGGNVTLPIVNAGGIRDASATAVAIQEDGKILVAGTAKSAATATSNQDFVLARFNADGTIDHTFGTGGQGYVVTDLLNSSGDDVPTSIAIQPYGGSYRILVAGSRANHSTGVRDFAVECHAPDGVTDTSFAVSGVLTTDFSSHDDVATGLLVKADGSFVVVGSSIVSGASHTAIARYSSNGALDTNFAPGASPAGQEILTLGTTDGAVGIAAAQNGKYLVGAQVNGSFALVRLTSTGAIDTTFNGGTNGGLSLIDGGADIVHGMAVAADGKVVLVGSTDTTVGIPPDQAVVRYNKDGTPDTSFGSGGKSTIDFGGGDTATGAVVDSTLNVIAVGSTDAGASATVLELQGNNQDVVYVAPDWSITGDLLPPGLSHGDTVSSTDGTVSGKTFDLDAFSSLQTAIDHVSAGGTVHILPGSYSGVLSINKRVIIVVDNPLLTQMSGLRIQLFSGADCTGSTGVAAGAVDVHAGALAQDGVLLARGGNKLSGGTDAGGIVTVDSGTAFASQDLYINKGIVIRGTTSDPTPLRSILMGSAEYLTLSSGGDQPVESLEVTGQPGGSAQDCMSLLSVGGTLTLEAGAAAVRDYSTQSLTIDKSSIAFKSKSGTVLLFSVTLTCPEDFTSSGPHSSGGVVSSDVTVQSSAHVNDGVFLADPSSHSVVTIDAGTYDEDVVINHFSDITLTKSPTSTSLPLIGSITGSQSKVKINDFSITRNLTFTACTDIYLHNVTCDGSAGDCLHVDGATTVTIDGGSFSHSSGAGISLSQISGACVLTNVQACFNELDNLSITQSPACDVTLNSGCTFNDSKNGCGVRLVDVHDNRDSDIQCERNRLSNLSIDQAHNVLLLGGIFDHSVTANGVSIVHVSGGVSVSGSTGSASLSASSNGNIGLYVSDVAGQVTMSHVLASGNTGDGMSLAHSFAWTCTDSTINGNGRCGIVAADMNGDGLLDRVDCKSNETCGNGFTSCASIHATNVHCDNTTNGGGWTLVGMLGDCVLTNCTGDGNSATGLSVSEVGSISVTGGSFSDNGGDGCSISKTTDAASPSFFRNCVGKRNGGHGIALGDLNGDGLLDSCVCTGNQLDNLQVDSDPALARHDISIVGGTFDGSVTGSGISLDHVGAVSISAKPASNGTPSFTPDITGNYQFGLIVTDCTSINETDADCGGNGLSHLAGGGISIDGVTGSVSITGGSCSGNEFGDGLSVSHVLGNTSLNGVDASHNAGSGISMSFSYAWSVISCPAGSNARYGIVVADMNGDGQLDLVSCSGNQLDNLHVDNQNASGPGNVTITGGSFTNSVTGSGIVLTNLHGNGIVDAPPGAIVSATANSKCALVVMNASNLSVAHLVASGNGIGGVGVWGLGGNASFSDCVASDNHSDAGILLDTVAGSVTLDQCTALNNPTGISVHGALSCTITASSCGAQAPSISEIGISLDSVHTITVRATDAAGNTGDGLRISNADTATVTDCNFIGNRKGLNAVNVRTAFTVTGTYSDGTFRPDSFGIYLSDCPSIAIGDPGVNGNIIANCTVGVYLGGNVGTGAQHVITNGQVYGCDTGIQVAGGDSSSPTTGAKVTISSFNYMKPVAGAALRNVNDLVVDANGIVDGLTDCLFGATGHFIDNGSPHDIDATQAAFDLNDSVGPYGGGSRSRKGWDGTIKGRAFDTEDKIVDFLDSPTLSTGAKRGYCKLQSGFIYATQSSEQQTAGVIRRCVQVAESGDTIHVQAGDFENTQIELVVVIAVLAIKGANSGIDPGNPTRGPETRIHGSLNVSASPGGSAALTIDGFTVDTMPPTIQGCVVDIQNNIIDSSLNLLDDGLTSFRSVVAHNAFHVTGGDAIVVQGGVVTINSNAIDCDGDGIDVTDCNDAAITGNLIAAGNQGVFLDGSVCTLDNNDITCVINGIVVQGGSHADILGNTLSSVTAGSGTGIQILNGDASIVGNTFATGAACFSTDVYVDSGAAIDGALTGNTFCATDFYIENHSPQSLTALAGSLPSLKIDPYNGYARTNGSQETNNFRIEDKILDKLDTPSSGLVTFVAGHLYVTSPSVANPDGSPSTDSDIQHAIACASAGDTISIEAGTYLVQNVLIDKPLTITGDPAASRDAIVLAPAIADGHQNDNFTDSNNAFIVHSDNVTIQHLSIDGNANPSIIGSDEYRNAVITDYNVGTFSSISVQDCAISNIFRKGVGLYSVDGVSHGNSIAACTFDHIGTLTGVGFEATFAIACFQSDCAITGNTITNCAGGIGTNYFNGEADAPRVTVTGNTFSSPLVPPPSNGFPAFVSIGLDLSGLADGSVISGNLIDMTGGTSQDIGIVVQYAVTGATVSVHDNSVVSDGNDVAVLLYHNSDPSSPVLVDHNTMRGNSGGIGALVTCDGSVFGESTGGNSYATLSDNSISGFTTGIKLLNTASLSCAATITGNHISGNTTGLWLLGGEAAIGGLGAGEGNDFSGGGGGGGGAIGANNLADCVFSLLSTVDHLQGNTFAGGVAIDNQSTSAIESRSNLYSYFETGDIPTGDQLTTPQGWVVEDHIIHALDQAGRGFVRTTSGQVFVTPSSASVQRGVDAASPGDTINIHDGLYVEQVSIGKDCTLLGQSEAGTIIQSPLSLPDGFESASSDPTAPPNPNHPIVYAHDFTVNVENLTVDGAGQASGNYRMDGIGYHNAGGLIDHVIVEHVRDNPLNGVQQGVGIFVFNDAAPHTITLTNNTIFDYQKNGMTLSGNGLSVVVDHNAVTGAGPTSSIAQNGIQVSFGAGGIISNNTVSGNLYTGDPNAAVSCDILLYRADACTVSGNTLTASNEGLYDYQSGGHEGIFANLISGATDTGIIIVGSSAAISNNDIHDNNDGIELFDDVSGTTISNNFITHNADDGIYVDSSVTDSSGGHLATHNNRISGNGAYGIEIRSSIVVDASSNWWGSANGPTAAGNTYNIGQQGDAIFGTAGYITWLAHGTDTLPAVPGFQPDGVLFAPVTLHHSGAADAYYSSIQAAVTASSNGDTIDLAAGTFTENVVINKAITLNGAGQGLTTIMPATAGADPGGTGSLSDNASNVILVQASNVTIQNLTVDGHNALLGGPGAQIVTVNGVDVAARNGIITDHRLLGGHAVFNNLNVNHVTVQNIYLRGIYASSGGTFDFQHNTVSNVAGDASSIAIFNYLGSGVIAWNSVTLTNDAISTNHSRGTSIHDNTITHADSGVHSDNNGDSGGTADQIYGNQVSLGTDGSYGIFVFSPYLPVLVHDNTISGVSVGLAAFGSEAAIVPTVTFNHNNVDLTGVAGETTGALVSTSLLGFGYHDAVASFTDNTIKGCWVGLDAQRDPMDPSTTDHATVSISGGKISADHTGIALRDGSVASISGVSFDPNATDLVLEAGSTLTALSGNAFSATTTYIDNQSANNIDAHSNTFSGVDPTAAGTTLAQEYAIEDKILDYLDYGSPRGYVSINPNNVYVTQLSETTTTGAIQRGLNVASPDDTVHVSAGSFSANLSVYQRTRLLGAGAGSDPSTNTLISAANPGLAIITVAASGLDAAHPLSIAGLFLTGSGSSGVLFDSAQSHIALQHLAVAGAFTQAIEVHNSAALTDLSLFDVSVSTAGSGTGFRMATTATIDGLSIDQSHFDNNNIGFYSNAASSSTHNELGLTHVSITNSTFSHDSLKGIYVEKLDHALLDHLTVDSSGTLAGGTGIDLNLKFGVYASITLSNCTITNSGHEAHPGQLDGFGVAIKGRNDVAPYTGNPASLTGVSLINLQITGSPTDLYIDNNTSGLSFSGVSLDGSGIGLSFGAPPAQTLSLGDTTFSATLAGYIVDFSANPVDATGATFGAVSPTDNVLSHLFGVVDKIADGVDVAGWGLVRIRANNVYVTPNSFFAPAGTHSPSIQRAVNLAHAGETVHVASGNYPGGVIIHTSLSIVGDGSPTVGTGDFHDGYGGAFEVSASGVTLSGMNMLGDGSVDLENKYGVLLTHGYSGATIQGNTIGGYGNAILVESDPNGASNTSIQGNIFNATALQSDGSHDFAVYLQAGDYHSVLGNHFNAGESGILIQGASHEIVDSNTFTSADNAAVIADASDVMFTRNIVTHSQGTAVYLGGGATNVSILDNEITGGLSNAIRLTTGFSPASNSGIDIENNFLSGNTYGLRIDAGALSGGLTLHQNSISGNSSAGVLNDSSVVVDGDYNWWGVASGPRNAANPAGTGDKVIGPVTFSPWLTDGTDTSAATGFQPNATTAVAISGAPTSTEGALYTLTLSPSSSITSWSINWGDGSAVETFTGSPATVDHQFTEEENLHPFTITAVAHTTSGAAPSNSVDVTVSDANLTGSSSALAGGTEGATGSSVLSGATFADANPGDHSSEFTATIDWGDTTTSFGTVSYSGGVYTVDGSHTYAEEGPYSISINVLDEGGKTTTLTGSANVADAALTGTLVPPSPTEGAALTNVVLFHFTDADPNGTAGDYTATVTWGDGLIESNGAHVSVVANSSGGFDVIGSHTYAEEAIGLTFSVSVTDHNATTGDSALINVADASLTPGTAIITGGTEGVTPATLTASFTDANAGATTADFSGTINWGDGHTTLFTSSDVSGSNGSYTVSGSHQYDEEGSYSVTVTINDDGGSSTIVGSSANVADANLTGSSSATAAGTEGITNSSVLSGATFTDANLGDHSPDFTATIHWGDTSTSTGLVSFSGGVYTVNGAHTYAEEGSYIVTIDVLDDGGKTATITGTATVSDASLTDTSAPATPTSVEGFSTGTLTVATFTDANPGAHTGDFTANIFWGDDTHSGGNVTYNPATGTYSVTGSHVYADENAGYLVIINVVDSGGSTLNGIGRTTVTVQDALLTNTSTPSTTNTVEGSSTGTLTVATFTDANPGNHAGDFSSFIHWGDGTSSGGDVTYNPATGTYSVSGSHAYGDESAGYHVTVDVSDHGSTLTGIGLTTVSVSDAPVTVALTGSHQDPANVLPNVAEASTFTLHIGPFTDPGSPSNTPVSYVIHWGDGTTTNNTDTTISEADLNAAGRNVTHVYADGTVDHLSGTTTPIRVDIVNTDDDGGIEIQSDAGALGVVVYNVPPTAVFGGSGTVNEGSSGSVLFVGQNDVSAPDRTAGFHYEYDFNNDGIVDLATTSASVTVPASFLSDEGSVVVRGRIYDKDGGFTDYFKTILVSNVTPIVNAGANTSISQNSTLSRIGSFIDPSADTWTATVDYGDGGGPHTLTLNPDKTFNLNHQYAVPSPAGHPYTVTVQVADDDGLIGTSTFTVTVVASTLQVTNFAPTTSGFDVSFNRAINAAVLNLYAASLSTQADITVVGQHTGPVRGSLVWDSAHNLVHFVASSILANPANPNSAWVRLPSNQLPADTYTVTLASRSDGIVDTGGQTLDGNGDGTAGDNYVIQLVVSTSPSVRTLSLPSFARGPRQTVDVSFDGTALGSKLPVRLSDGAGVTAVDFELDYDPTLLNISGVASPPSGWNVTINSNTPGKLLVTVSGTTALSSGPQDIVSIVATVPSDAPYGASEAIVLTGVRVNEGAIAAQGLEAIHKVTFFGDATGNGTVGGSDANLISRNVVHLDNGFDAAPLTDPLIIGDVTGDGTFSGLDASYVAQKNVGLPRPEIPNVPAGLIVPSPIDPTVTIPSNVHAPRGSTTHVPVSISDNAGGLISADDLHITYDASVIHLSNMDVNLSSYLASLGWGIATNVDGAGGLIQVTVYSTTDSLPSGAADLLDLAISVPASVPLGSTSPLTTTSGTLNEGKLVMSTQNGSIKVVGALNLVGTPGNDDFRLVRDNDGTDLDVFQTGQPMQAIPLDSITAISVSGLGGDDTLTVDLSTGNPIPAAIPFSYDGGTGVNTLAVIGTSGDDTLTAGASSATLSSATPGIGSISLTLANVQGLEMPGSGGHDSLHITGGSYLINANTSPGTPGTSVTIDAGASGNFASDQELAALTLNGSASVGSSTDAKTLTVGTLTIGNPGLLDLIRSTLLVDNTLTSITTIQDYWRAGYNMHPYGVGDDFEGAGFWDGTHGITSSVARADQSFKHQVGYIDGNVQNIYGFTMADIGGPDLATNRILVRPVLMGDVNFDGKVDPGDIQVLLGANKFGKGPGAATDGWIDGDFNGDQESNPTDIQLLLAANTFNSGMTFAPAVAAPVTLAPAAPSTRAKPASAPIIATASAPAIATAPAAQVAAPTRSTTSAKPAVVPIQQGPSAPFAARTQLSTNDASTGASDTATLGKRKHRKMEVFRA